MVKKKYPFDNEISLKLTLLLFLILPSWANAQTKERIINYNDQPFTGSRQIVNNNNSLFINVLKGDLAFDEIVKENWIYKLDYDLETTDSIDLTQYLNLHNQEYARFHDMKIKSDSLFCLFEIQSVQPSGSCTNTFRTTLVVLDTNLNFLNLIELKDDSFYYAFYTMAFDSLGNIYLGGRAGPCAIGVTKAVVKLTPNIIFNKISYLDSLPISERYGYLQTINFFGNKIVAGGAPFNTSQRNSTVVLDTALNVLGTGTVNNSDGSAISFFRPYQQYLSFKPNEIMALGITISDIVSSTGNRNYYNLGFSILDSNFNISSVDTLPLIGHFPPNKNTIRPYPYLNPRAGYDYKNPDSLLIAVNHSSILFDTYGEQDTNTFSLYNYNLRTKTLNWRKQIKTGLTNGGHNVAALPGNRYALTFNQYNWRDFTQPNLSLHIWILNGAGDVISTKEYQQSLPQWAVYPNPVQEQLTLPKAATEQAAIPYSVFNTQGATFAQGVLEKGQTQIRVENLPAGSYVLQSPKGVARFVKQ
jgi:hypothetical protein